MVLSAQCTFDDPFGDVFERIHENHTHRCFVLDEERKPVGIITLKAASLSPGLPADSTVMVQEAISAAVSQRDSPGRPPSRRSPAKSDLTLDEEMASNETIESLASVVKLCEVKHHRAVMCPDTESVLQGALSGGVGDAAGHAHAPRVGIPACTCQEPQLAVAVFHSSAWRQYEVRVFPFTCFS